MPSRCSSANRACSACRSRAVATTPATSSTISARSSSTRPNATTSARRSRHGSPSSAGSKGSSDVVSLDEARAYVLQRVAPLEVVRAHPRDLAGCVLAEPVTAPEDVPPFDNTAVDGFAVRAADTAAAPVVLRIDGTLYAGADPSGIAVTAGG